MTRNTLGSTLDGIEALAALARFGTVSEAATRLRLTQSAVSKRIAALGRGVGFRVVAPEGRRVRITAEAEALLDRARPLLAELRALAAPSAGASQFSLALADSIAASWGPAVVAAALAESAAKSAGLSLRLHAHRSVLLVESVRLGRYQLGLSSALPASDLLQYPVTDEPLVLVHAGLAERPDARAPLITIEAGSATWRAIEPLLRRRQPRLLSRPIVPVESFSAALQMVKAGFGDGLVPLGLVLADGVERAAFRALAGVRRPVVLLTRKTVHQEPSFATLRDGIIAETARFFSDEGRGQMSGWRARGRGRKSRV
jgi:DNA-binding transcriptional LysR family regulator